jgi:ferric-dicitrate binding protein FerR (iron transport regulator)
MHDDEPIDVERRLRTALRPDEERTRTVIARALSAEPRRSSRWRAPLFAAAIVVLALMAASLWRQPVPEPAALVISGSGSVVVVTTADGRRWVINAERPSTSSGQYVIAFPR